MWNRAMSRVCAGCVPVVLLWGVWSGAADLDPSIEMAPEEASRVAETRWWERDQVLGDVGGLRSWLGERGVSLEIESVDEGLGNQAGGIGEGSRYKGLTNLSLVLDTEAVGWWRGGEFVTLIQNSRGEPLTEDCVGDIQTVSNIDAPEFTQVSEYFLEQRLGAGRLKVGRQDANADFVVAEGGGEFVNSSFGLVPTVPLPTYPAPALGVSAFAPVTGRLELGAGVWDGASDLGNGCFETAFDGVGGAVSALQLAVATGGGGILPGRYQVGLWYHSEVESPIPGAKAAHEASSASGVFLVADQELVRRDDLVVRAFGQGGIGDGEATGIAEYVGAGLVAEGLIPGRPDDSVGLGYARASIHDRESAADLTETVIEAYYAARILPWLVVKPDLQLVQNPGGRGEDAVVLGVRFETRL